MTNRTSEELRKLEFTFIEIASGKAPFFMQKYRKMEETLQSLADRTRDEEADPIDHRTVRNLCDEALAYDPLP